MTKALTSSQKGAALFIILIAVALFAALGYAVSQSGRGSGSVDREKAQLRAARLIQQGTMMETTIIRLQLFNKCSSMQISFENPLATGYTNALSPTDKSCNVFASAGGGLTYVQSNPEDIDASYTGNGSTLMAGPVFVQQWATGRDDGASGLGPTDNWCGTAPYCADFLMIIPAVKRDICLEINSRMGISTVSGDAPPQLWGCGLTAKEWNGTNPVGCKWTFNTNEVKSFPTGCVKGVGSMAGGYFFYHLILGQ